MLAIRVGGRGEIPDAQLIEWLEAGSAVFVADLSGYGETATKPWRFGKNAGSNAAEFYIAQMLGRSLVGLRAEECIAVGAWLHRVGFEYVELDVAGNASVAGLHAAGCEPKLFGRVKLRSAPKPWVNLLVDRKPVGQLENMVHGALQHYDLPDLVRLAEKHGMITQSEAD